MGPVVDVHAHTLVPDAESLARPECAGEWPRGLVDLDTRLAAMNLAGIDVQAVSAAPRQFHYWAGPSLAAELVTRINAGVASLARQAPDRLVGVGTVALQHPDLAAEQLRHAVDDYDFRGVQIGTAAAWRALSDRALDPFWSMAELLGVPVLIHPVGSEAAGGLGRVLRDLLSGGVFQRFPDLAVCVTPDGERFPHLAIPTERAGCRDLVPGGHVYVDSLVGDDASLVHLVNHAGTGNVLLGTGYPFGVAITESLARVAVLPPDEREATVGRNAVRLFRLRKS
jgi:aminocarboxymuconate-semialdehyde decarboxylase